MYAGYVKTVRYIYIIMYNCIKHRKHVSWMLFLESHHFTSCSEKSDIPHLFLFRGENSISPKINNFIIKA